jgi:hypothetical protein
VLHRLHPIAACLVQLPETLAEERHDYRIDHVGDAIRIVGRQGELLVEDGGVGHRRGVEREGELHWQADHAVALRTIRQAV